MRAVAAVVAAVVALAPASAAGQEDVDLIPEGLVTTPSKAPTTAPPKAAARPSTLEGKFFLEDAFSAWTAPARVPVPYPAALAIDGQNRTSFDASFRYKPWPGWAFTLSDRANVFVQDGQKVLSANTVRNDLREASMTWEALTQTYLEAGRINVRNGAALGFNPTDFFKTRTLVGQASLDPSVIRQNRLGTLMARAQMIWSGGSASVAYAPKVAHPSQIAPSDPAANNGAA